MKSVGAHPGYARGAANQYPPTRCGCQSIRRIEEPSNKGLQVAPYNHRRPHHSPGMKTPAQADVLASWPGQDSPPGKAWHPDKHPFENGDQCIAECCMSLPARRPDPCSTIELQPPHALARHSEAWRRERMRRHRRKPTEVCGGRLPIGHRSVISPFVKGTNALRAKTRPRLTVISTDRRFFRSTSGLRARATMLASLPGSILPISRC